MSPEISTECFAHPSQEDTVSGVVGTTSATGRPNLVTRTGAPVRRTSSRTAKHVALNLEIAISRIFHLYHGPIPWSKLHLTEFYSPSPSSGLYPFRNITSRAAATAFGST